jgi:ATP-dependent DNA ligase
VRLFTRNGYDWTGRYPWIVEAALKIRQKRFVLDGEAVILGVDGIADFNALHSRLHDHEVQLYAFDILAEGGDDLRKLPLHLRKTSLQRLLARRPEGIFVNPFERGEMGRTYSWLGSGRIKAGRSKHWIKVKNRTHPAMYRVMDACLDRQVAPKAGRRTISG